ARSQAHPGNVDRSGAVPRAIRGILPMIPGFSSTQSKRPEALFGAESGMPVRMTRANGCRVWDDQGREYLDTIMALGAVGLGYAHPAVTAAVECAARDGVVGPLAPAIENEVAEELAAV